MARPGELLPLVAANRNEHRWAACAFGPQEAACVVTAAALGGHVRVGFENNLHLPDGTQAPDNAAILANIAGAMSAIGRPLADPDTARAIIANR
ncbi:MAG: 3-keto-5-aminohexanoate cleavage protein [Myxococcota bacterium]